MAGKSIGTGIPKGFKGKGHKYKVSPKEDRIVDGIMFHSKKEAKRYKELRLLEREGLILGLTLQPVFRFDVSYSIPAREGEVRQSMRYIGDFQYTVPGETKPIVEDVKGMLTAEFKRKKKLFEKLYQDFKLVLT